MEISITTVEELESNPLFEKVVKETMDDRLLYREAIELIKKSQLFSLKIEGVIIGFYSLDDLENCVEIHFYIYTPYRKHSLYALRRVMESQERDIKTSVYGTHFHVVKFLTKKGFKVTDVLMNTLVKHGKTYNVFELYYKQSN